MAKAFFGGVHPKDKKAATCDKAGSYDLVVYCSVCNAELSRETKPVDALGHKYEASETAPTCVAAGYTTYTCSVCGDTYKVDGAPATGVHTNDNDQDADCNICGEVREVKPAGPVVDANLDFFTKSISFETYIGLQYIMDPAVYSAYSNVYIKVVAPDGTSINVESVDYYGYRVFNVPVYALDMAKVYTMTVYAEKDGKEVYNAVEATSVELKVKANLESFKSQPKVLKILVDMLNYGAALQTKYQVELNNMPNDELEAYAEYMTTTMPEMKNTNTEEGTGTVKPFQMSFGIQDKVTLQVIYTAADVAGREVRCRIGDGEEVVIKAEEMTDYYGFMIAEFAFKPEDMRTAFTVGLYDTATGELVSALTKATAQGYAATLLGGEYNDIAIAMMRYCDAVLAYLGK